MATTRGPAAGILILIPPPECSDDFPMTHRWFSGWRCCCGTIPWGGWVGHQIQQQLEKLSSNTSHQGGGRLYHQHVINSTAKMFLWPSGTLQPITVPMSPVRGHWSWAARRGTMVCQLLTSEPREMRCLWSGLVARTQMDTTAIPFLHTLVLFSLMLAADVIDHLDPNKLKSSGGLHSPANIGPLSPRGQGLRVKWCSRQIQHLWVAAVMASQTLGMVRMMRQSTSPVAVGDPDNGGDQTPC